MVKIMQEYLGKLIEFNFHYYHAHISETIQIFNQISYFPVISFFSLR